MCASCAAEDLTEDKRCLQPRFDYQSWGRALPSARRIHQLAEALDHRRVCRVGLELRDGERKCAC